MALLTESVVVTPTEQTVIFEDQREEQNHQNVTNEEKETEEKELKEETKRKLNY